MNLLLQVNGAPVQVDVEPAVMLLEVLRDRLGLLGARGTCGVGLCGTCTVLLDGEPISSCILLAPLAQGHAITTIEGVPDDDPVMGAFDRHPGAGAPSSGSAQIATMSRLLLARPQTASEVVS